MNDSATFIPAQATVAQTKAAPNIGRVKGMDEARKVAVWTTQWGPTSPTSAT